MVCNRSVLTVGGVVGEAVTYPDVPLHVIADNCSAHKHADVTAWLERHSGCSCTSPRPTCRG